MNKGTFATQLHYGRIIRFAVHKLSLDPGSVRIKLKDRESIRVPCCTSCLLRTCRNVLRILLSLDRTTDHWRRQFSIPYAADCCSSAPLRNLIFPSDLGRGVINQTSKQTYTHLYHLAGGAVGHELVLLVFVPENVDVVPVGAVPPGQEPTSIDRGQRQAEIESGRRAGII